MLFLNIKKLVLFTFVLCFAFTVNAGQNKDASIYIDNDFKSELLLEKSCEIVKGDECFIAIHVKNAKRLHSYSVKLSFNEDIVNFEEAARSTQIGEKAFLESDNGKIVAFLVFPKQNIVELAATLSGKENTVSGDGVLGYLTFRCIKNGNPEFKIVEIKLVDNKGVMDNITISSNINKLEKRK